MQAGPWLLFLLCFLKGIDSLSLYDNISGADSATVISMAHYMRAGLHQSIVLWGEARFTRRLGKSSLCLVQGPKLLVWIGPSAAHLRSPLQHWAPVLPLLMVMVVHNLCWCVALSASQHPGPFSIRY
jgi:hypothetical protein